MKADIQIRGIAKAQRRYKATLSKPIRHAVFLGVNYMRNRAKDNLQSQIYQRSVPWRRSGKLQQSIAGKMISQTAGQVTVGAAYGKYVEFGTKPHIIRPKNGKLLAFQKQQPVMGGGYLNKKTGKLNKRSSKNTLIFAREVRHPGTKAYPFFYPALEDTRKQLPVIFKQQIKKHFDALS